MPNCRNCKREISRFDKDVCPHCGTLDPIGDGYKTRDMTSFVDPLHPDYKLYKSKSRKVTAILCLLLGFLGIHNFYLGFAKKGWWEAVISLIIINVFGLGLCLVSFFKLFVMPYVVCYLIPFGVVFIAFALRSIHYFTKDSLKDASGEFLR